MRFGNILRFSLGALQGNRVRTMLMLLAMSIGVVSVVLLTAVGEGARLFHISWRQREREVSTSSLLAGPPVWILCRHCHVNENGNRARF